MSNRNSGTEDDVGKLHKLITMCHNLKTGKMLELAEQLLHEGHDAEEIAMAINSRDLTAAQKWVEYNGISCLTAEDNEESDLKKRLNKIRETQSKASKIVSMTDVKDEATGG